MLLSLSIKNYALIRNLKVDFKDGLSIITGETGAGKSILLGGLSLVLGKRADTSLVYDKTKKCVIEAEFAIRPYSLQRFFKEQDLDYEDVAIVRREILPHGKSRAFVNDTPVNLDVLSGLAERLIDIHSQHETLQLAASEYQFGIIDALAGNQGLLKAYTEQYATLGALRRELAVLREKQAAAQREFDYNQFVYRELENAGLITGEQEELEESLQKWSHVEEIKANLTEFLGIAENESHGLIVLLGRMRQNLSKVSAFTDKYKELYERLESLWIELKDILSEAEMENEGLDFDPSELETVQERLELIYGLLKKHAVTGVEDLLEVKNSYEAKLQEVELGETWLAGKENEILKTTDELKRIGIQLRRGREAAIPDFKSQIESVLSKLEMGNTRVHINLIKEDDLLGNGMDRLEFLLSSDKGKTFERLKNIASGGEMSRIMLAVKSILSRYSRLPAIVFDEIDTGVSGEVSNRIAELLREMSENMQVIAITHLPQIAAKGDQHYKVFKQETDEGVSSNIKILDESERLVALAEMLSGSQITDSAMAHARQLLS